MSNFKIICAGDSTMRGTISTTSSIANNTYPTLYDEDGNSTDYMNMEKGDIIDITVLYSPISGYGAYVNRSYFN